MEKSPNISLEDYEEKFSEWDIQSVNLSSCSSVENLQDLGKPKKELSFREKAMLKS